MTQSLACQAPRPGLAWHSAAIQQIKSRKNLFTLLSPIYRCHSTPQVFASLAILYPAARPTHCGRPCQPNPQHVIAAEKEATPSFQIADGRELETARNVGHPLSHSTVALTASDCSTKKDMPGAVAVSVSLSSENSFAPLTASLLKSFPGALLS
jgi:hypothetical protein